MSGKWQLTYHEHDDSDEEADIHAKQGKHPTDESSDLDEELVQEETCEAKQGSKCASASGLLDIINTYDRKAGASAEGSFANCDNYAVSFENKPGKRIPKAGIHAEAGVGRARAEYSIFEAEARGPNASFGAEASVTKVGALARAELASASAKAGPLHLKAGVALDTGVSAGLGGVEVKFLGTGFSIGPKMGISLFGSEISFSFL
ncbi:uncharacterized protein LOC130552938 [Triplophysa rosa]|uniref:Uncharacterized protein n=1 Tax=Triplophysa rosa TaxID=992332 RepID=A0A9W7X068_TRIRA|nr:uncharacterized protein LOC130552938 [Triplophysa rosa]KAI7811261.1 hypothetical protein IRJ41_012223 [Triplophysa rosa]